MVLRNQKVGVKISLIWRNSCWMALEYLREYRTYFHIDQNYGISESSAYKAVKWVEDTLV
ncbi:DDE superendonuclease family protein [Orientia tsutsugamushi str. Gilliam]|nr:DDE superendonuclease family protein [Orientia tsutsugamushi str. Gilliam]KJV54242.1 DDE superendonuclease family protein [Orientia tsutsugamushi str. Gilliam]SPR02165.1 IS5 family transposase ISOt6 [Orientia tsutsugamushi str. Gilliam]SPR09035.1 IS5 family transposase ISOt6 [Orientia tsutsugamushi str. Gilliam]